MNIKITGKELKATESIKDYAQRKIERLEKYFGEDIDVLVTIKTEGNEQVAELHVTAAGETLRAVTAHRDLYASIDKDINNILQYKTNGTRRCETRTRRKTKKQLLNIYKYRNRKSKCNIQIKR